MTDASGALVGGRYRLVELVGQGGMGRVWRGFDETLHREVAVKELLLPADLAEPARRGLIERATAETRAAARLQDPGIVIVHDVVEQDGVPWIVMEYIAGTSLGARLAAQGPLGWRRAAEIGVSVAEALAHAHAAGAVHRDLKPDNVLLAGERTVITDFGIARILDATTRLTSTHAVVGTPQYMSPEQLQGHDVTTASDMWALGATLYAAVEGHPPYDGPTVWAVVAAVVSEPLSAPGDAGPLAGLIASLLDRDPDRRPDARSAARILHELLHPASEPPHPPTVVDAPSDADAEAAAVAGADTVTSVAPESEEALQKAGPGPSRRTVTLGGLGVLAVAAGATVAALVADGQGNPNSRASGGSHPSGGSDSTSPDTLPGYTGKVNSVAFTPDGRTLVAGCDDGKVRLWDVTSRAVVGILVGHTSAVGPVAVSPDGKAVASGSDDTTIRLWSLATRTAFASVSFAADLAHLAFSPDGKTLAATGYLGLVWLYNAADGSAAGQLDAPDVLQYTLAYSPDGKTLATGSLDGKLVLWNTAARNVEATLSPGSSIENVVVAYSPDGRTVASASTPLTDQGLGRTSIQFWNATTHAKTTELLVNPTVYALNAIALSPDGRSAAGAGSEDSGGAGSVLVWDIVTRAVTAVFGAHLGDANSVAFSPDGRTLASASQGAQLWKLP
ncbi:WD40 repeat domain-containing serine/threonine protein kinase [Streptacidiphilus fuscans]|uniref:non-specific serine/threonine protein kinase n=1 Tax=Streptacidiphilus fuscans TaxID=2789292 RepID=A0A931FD61_9ACTN|nr:serine/threonine-protein kinase [Streptacidiphilus fuscans]MBF9069228.1 serine/threonine protein kinase [Streptacidiphilus fuscans]